MVGLCGIFFTIDNKVSLFSLFSLFICVDVDVDIDVAKFDKFDARTIVGLLMFGVTCNLTFVLLVFGEGEGSY